MHQQLTLAQFNAHYFYKTELVSLCKQYGLPAYGTKAELNQYIRLYLSGEPITHIKSTRKRPPHKKLTTGQLSLKTKIVGSGFKFNNEAREFFANYFGVAHFSFKKEMAIIKRRAETTHDNQLTVGDLLKLYTDMVAQNTQNQVRRQTHEESTYQWNNFVKDFYASRVSAQYTNKLKVAAILWHHVKNTPQSKIYHDNLVSKYAEEINYFKK